MRSSSAVADSETGLGSPRLPGELTRTVVPAAVLRRGPARGLLPRGDHRPPGRDARRRATRTCAACMRPRGAVGVFGASNFPFAFSVPGGDTASALAAGCPVVAKAHEAHPLTSRLCFEALAAGARGRRRPRAHRLAGRRLGRGPARSSSTRGSGLSASPGRCAGGRALADIAAARPVPIPFFGELGAVNAVVVCRTQRGTRGADIAAGLVASFTLGVGQFCTKPGLVLLPDGSRRAGPAGCAPRAGRRHLRRGAAQRADRRQLRPGA